MKIQAKYFIYATIIYLITAYFSLGHLHPDEYYQILEFAAYKLHLNSPNGLTWEFYEQIRPTIQVWPVVYLYQLIANFTLPNPFFVAFLTRAFSGVLSLLAIYLFIKTFINQLDSTRKQHWFILLSIFSWLAVFNSIRYSSENISGKLFLIALCLILSAHGRKSFLHYLFYGIILGLSFIVRYQTGFMIIGFFMWLVIINRTPMKYCVALALGVLLAIALGSISDYYFYGNWVFTPWRYFAANILQGKAATFSEDPWYFYLSIAGFVPYGPLFIVASLYFMWAYPKHTMTWIMLPFIVVHLIISHKEPRFLTPLLSFMPLVILLSLQHLEQKYNWHLGKKLTTLNTFAWRFNLFAVAVVMFFPSAMQIRINELLYKNYWQPTAFNYLTEGGNVLDFYKHTNLRLIPIQEPHQLDCHNNENCIVALTCQETVKYGAPAGKLIFSDCPSWIFKLNFNGWLDRTALYNIYEMHSIESK